MTPESLVWVVIAYHSDRSGATIVGAASTENLAYALLGRYAAIFETGEHFRVDTFILDVVNDKSVFPLCF